MLSTLRVTLRALTPQALRRELHRFYECVFLVGAIVRTLGARLFFWKRGLRQGEEYRRSPDFANADTAGSEALRVLMVSGSHPPMHCGVGDYSAHLVRSLNALNGVAVHLLTSTQAAAESAPAWLHADVSAWTYRGLAAFRRLLSELQPDIVHLQYPTQGYSSWIGPAEIPGIARRLGNSVIVETWHEYPHPVTSGGGWALMAMAAAADALIYVRPDYARHISPLLGRMIGEIPRYFVPNGPSVPTVRLSQRERDEVRAMLATPGRRIVAYFGFAYRHKGVHHLFRIADPREDQLVLIGELLENDAYHAHLLRLARSSEWRDRVTLYGFAAPDEVARILAAADAAVFPFEDGGGIWNSSVHAATSQGTFTVLTSHERFGYASAENVYYAVPGSIEEMKSALRRFAGRRVMPPERDEWRGIAQTHLDIYRTLLAVRR